MIVLDTDVISELMHPRPSPPLLARLRDIPVREQHLKRETASVVTHGRSEKTE